MLFDKSTRLQKIAEKAFIEVMTREYEMLLIYRPQELKLGTEQSLRETTQNNLQSMVKIDRGKMNDLEYL